MRVESSLRGGEDLVYCKYISILESKQSITLHRQAYAQTIISEYHQRILELLCQIRLRSFWLMSVETLDEIG